MYLTVIFIEQFLLRYWLYDIQTEVTGKGQVWCPLGSFVRSLYSFFYWYFYLLLKCNCLYHSGRPFMIMEHITNKVLYSWISSVRMSLWGLLYCSVGTCKCTVFIYNQLFFFVLRRSHNTTLNSFTNLSKVQFSSWLM